MKRFNLNTVRKLLSQESTPPQLSQRTQSLRHPTKYQWTLLHKLRAIGKCTSKGVPRADRGVFKRQRGMACQTATGKERRRGYVLRAVEEIDAAKKAELWFLRDEERRKVGGRHPYQANAPRRHKKTVARDVQVWLAWKRVGKFGVNTIREDLRYVKKGAS